MSRVRLTIKIERLHQNGGVAQRAEIKHLVKAEQIMDPANPSHNAMAAQLLHKIAEGVRGITLARAEVKAFRDAVITGTGGYIVHHDGSVEDLDVRDLRDIQMESEINGA